MTSYPTQLHYPESDLTKSLPYPLTHGDFHSAAPLGNQVVSPMTQYPTQTHYPDTELSSACPIILIPSFRLGSDKYKFDKSLV